ncbi:LLM class flavin-dependent oxidoreductase, partial [Paenarthrobacter sp. CM16]|nr:LLM class flavin-dependent oxidoreductase [Paenarthrobacter sp. CM16]
LQSVSLPTTLPFGQQLEILERFALEVIPAVRAAAPTTLWESGDPFGGRPELAGATDPDAAATVTADHALNRTDNALVYAH